MTSKIKALPMSIIHSPFQSFNPIAPPARYSQMSYQIKEIFYTLQGEGRHAGRAAVFCRFTGCNLWSGREADRNTAICRFCDTDFVGTDGTAGGKYVDAAALCSAIDKTWESLSLPLSWTGDLTNTDSNTDSNTKIATSHVQKMVVLTGGEPLLQVDAALVDALHQAGFFVAVESNGTVFLPKEIAVDWLCISPKMGAVQAGQWVQKMGQELKVIWPQMGLSVLDLQSWGQLPFDNHALQPMDDGGVLQKDHIRDCVALCMSNPTWRLSLQTHKTAGIR